MNRQRSVRGLLFFSPWRATVRASEGNRYTQHCVLSPPFLPQSGKRRKNNLMFHNAAFIIVMAVTQDSNHWLCRQISKVKDAGFPSIVPEAQHVNALPGLQVKHRAVVSKLPICLFNCTLTVRLLSPEYTANTHIPGD